LKGEVFAKAENGVGDEDLFLEWFADIGDGIYNGWHFLGCKWTLNQDFGAE
jgi:hypothetical protein